VRRWGAVRASTSFPTAVPTAVPTVVPTANREPSAEGLALGIVEAPFPSVETSVVMVVVAAAAAAAVGLTRELTGRPGVGSCAAIKDNHELRQSRTIMASAPARRVPRR
jgi:hypothetical protein